MILYSYMTLYYNGVYTFFFFYGVQTGFVGCMLLGYKPQNDDILDYLSRSQMG